MAMGGMAKLHTYLFIILVLAVIVVAIDHIINLHVVHARDNLREGRFVTETFSLLLLGTVNITLHPQPRLFPEGTINHV